MKFDPSTSPKTGVAIGPGARKDWALSLFVALAMSLFCTPRFPGVDLALQTLHEFNANPKNPRAGLVQGQDGSFYGTTVFGGSSGENGTVFQFTPTGGLNILHSFSGPDGASPYASLVQGTDGVLYGTTQRGGTNGDFGTIFRITTNAALTLLHSFGGSDGRNPQAALVDGNDGSFYGTTAFGGPDGDHGTVFKTTPRGVFTALVSFNGVNGRRPVGALIRGGDGNFYGTTSEGGPAYDGTVSFGLGTVFRITPDGTLTSLFSFNGTDGSGPASGLAEGSDGNFYGTTQFSGANGDYGTIFKITPNGALTTLFSFSGPDGNYPLARLTLASDANWYGTTSGDRVFGGTNTFGTAFRFTPAGILTTLAAFAGANGASPVAGLTQGSDGSFYGTTFEGGAGGGGTIFRLVEWPIITGIVVENENVIVTWRSIPGGLYRVEYKSTLADPSWTTLLAEVLATSNRTFITSSLGGVTERYYRIRLLP